MKVLAAYLFIIIAYVVVNSSLGIEVAQCPNNARQIENLDEKIVIGNCKAPPCRLRKNTSVNVSMKFTPDKDVKSLQNSVAANIVGVPFPFIGVDGTDACTNIYKADGTTKAGCPLKSGEEYVYKTKIDVLGIYPRLKLVVHWALRSADGDVICFEVPARITN